jgi:photosystem II stability/assembly factor-like uncharacterized protein
MTSNSYSTTGLVYAWDVDKLYRSIDGGRSFIPLQTPLPSAIQAVTEDAHGALYLGVQQVTGTGSTGGLFVSHDAGSTWTRLGQGTPLDQGVLSVTVLPSGNVLVGPYSNRGGGLQCSSNGGQTWAARCQ